MADAKQQPTPEPIPADDLVTDLVTASGLAYKRSKAAAILIAVIAIVAILLLLGFLFYSEISGALFAEKSKLTESLEQRLASTEQDVKKAEQELRLENANRQAAVLFGGGHLGKALRAYRALYESNAGQKSEKRSAKSIKELNSIVQVLRIHFIAFEKILVAPPAFFIGMTTIGKQQKVTRVHPKADWRLLKEVSGLKAKPKELESAINQMSSRIVFAEMQSQQSRATRTRELKAAITSREGLKTDLENSKRLDIESAKSHGGVQAILVRTSVSLGAIGIAVFLMHIFLGNMRYHARLSAHYAAQARALKLMDGDPEKLPAMLTAFAPGVEFGKPPSTIIEEIAKAVTAFAGNKKLGG